jgi:hypothetical protein
MNKFRFTIQGLAVVIFTLAFVSLAQAQATRTWVSGVGDDVNPCSRTAPCKTWAGAISKTFINGEIDALDEGGFGTLTITKSITIEGTFGGGFGSTLASGTVGFTVNAVANANDPLRTVRLRNLSITGVGASGAVGTRTGTNGVRILSALNVFIENTLITDFSNRGITDERTSGGGLFVTDTIVRNCGASGIVVIGSGVATKAVLDNVHADLNGSSGIVVSGSVNQMVVRNCSANKNTGGGMVAELSSKMDIINSISVNNATGVESDTSAEIRVSRTTISRNTANGLGLGGGTILSYGTNEVSANTGNETFSPGGPTLK